MAMTSPEGILNREAFTSALAQEQIHSNAKSSTLDCHHSSAIGSEDYAKE